MPEQKNGYASENGEKAPTLWGWHTYLSIGIAAVILGVLVTMVDLEKVWNELLACDRRFIILGMLAHYLTYPVRGLRWRRSLNHLPARGGTAKFTLLLFFYNTVDNIVPAKLGDLYGAHLARINCGIRRSAALGSIVFLRMMDAWVVLMLALASSWFLFSNKLPKAVLWALIGGVFVAVVTTSVMLLFFLVKRSLPGWVPKKIELIIDGFRTGMWPRASEVVPIAALTVTIWTLETLWIYLLALGFRLEFGVGEAVFLTMIPLLATAFPLTPSGAGVVELTLFSCLRLVGVSASLAASVTVVNRFIDYWLHICFGVLIWVMRKRIRLHTWREIPLDNIDGVHSLKPLVGQEDFS